MNSSFVRDKMRDMNFLKRKSTWAVVVLLVVGGAVWAARRGPDVELVTEPVQRGTFVQTVETTGLLESTRTARVSFEASGTVEAVLVSVGDSVAPGQMLGTLRAADQYADVEQQRRALQAAQAALDARLAGSTDEAVAAVRAAVQVAEAGERAAEAALEGARTDVENARRAVDRARENNVQALEEARQGAVYAMTSGLIAVRKGVADSDGVLGIDNPFGNAAYRNVLSAADMSALIDARAAYATAKNALRAAEESVFALTPAADDAAVRAALPAAEKALADAALLLLHVNRVLDATAVDTNEFTAAELNAVKAALHATRQGVQTAQSGLLTAQQALVSAPLAAARAEDAARAELDRAETAHRAAEANLVVRQGERARASAQLAEAEARPRSVDVAVLSAQVDQARAALAASELRLAKVELRAPIAGTVTAVDVRPGEAVATGSPVLTIQAVDGRFDVATSLPEADIAKVSVGNPAEVTFDAFGDLVRFPATVAFIEPAPNPIDGVVYYKATVLLDPVEDGRYELRPGLSADVTITSARLEDVLTVPQRAVLIQDGATYVRVKTGDTTFEERFVETGLRGLGRVHVLDGLSEGEEIVITVRTL